MAIINEKYVSFEVAKLLKEKGFDGFCHRYYDYDITNHPNDTSGLCFMFASDFEQKSYCYVTNETFTKYNKEHELNMLVVAPTQQMAMRWLREVHKILITIIPQEVYVGVDSMCYAIYRITESLYQPLYNGKVDSIVNSYEEACEAAIKYCLENLIK